MDHQKSSQSIEVVARASVDLTAPLQWNPPGRWSSEASLLLISPTVRLIARLFAACDFHRRRSAAFRLAAAERSTPRQEATFVCFWGELPSASGLTLERFGVFRLSKPGDDFTLGLQPSVQSAVAGQSWAFTPGLRFGVRASNQSFAGGLGWGFKVWILGRMMLSIQSIFSNQILRVRSLG